MGNAASRAFRSRVGIEAPDTDADVTPETDSDERHKVKSVPAEQVTLDELVQGAPDSNDGTLGTEVSGTETIVESGTSTNES